MPLSFEINKRKIKNLGFISAAILFGIGCITLYKSIQSEETPNQSKSENKGDKTKEIANKYTSKPVTIVVTDSIISAKLRLGEILSLTQDVVLVLDPNLNKQDLIGIEPQQEYKIIECESYDGLWSIVKHLNSELIFVVKDDLIEDLPKNLSRFVGEIIELEQNFAHINQKIISYIMN
ncbi:Peroxisome assembly protein 22 [Wickerhamomyces ciferrii]|uniref:Peroxisome assembly protein 22 n=1 Tax=Wickerhamomyces ciferrii (strain ATCC 14091 / BCRC 22168 / CBS 111 / JCM 3599 / NBRC 0793 / NRRL Y-1031 F-60-10) TaxID=1206466 RepID=K0KTQ5_WICCF|nr:Peroxisome assembly protein 22 [Wickerhamomyces ciferrii]CCH44643.1 Peroxisome assembly protein 22 [Wickerhamomyces ciferrii]